MLQDTAFLFIPITCMHCRLQWKYIYEIRNIALSSLSHISNWPVIIFSWSHDHWDFSLNPCSFQHKRQIMLKEWADASFFSFICRIWCVAPGPICCTLFKCHSEDWIITFCMGIPYGIYYYCIRILQKGAVNHSPLYLCELSTQLSH